MDHPKIEDAKTIAEKYHKDMVIIFHIDRNEKIGFASYGKNRELCEKAKLLANVMFNTVAMDNNE